MGVLTFERGARVEESAPQRMDIACFVGHVALRDGVTVPAPLRAWLAERRFPALPRASSPSDVPASADTLLNVPVPLDSWTAFDQLFAWDARPLTGHDLPVGTYLGAAVRSFFAEGGRRCYVVRVGAPWAAGEAADDASVRARLEALMPGIAGPFVPAAADPVTWRGAGWVLGLPDVSFLCLPDLPDIVGTTRPRVPPDVIEREALEQFIVCSQPETRAPDSGARYVEAPRCDEDGYQVWASAVARVRQLLVRQAREVQLLAALPLPVQGSDAEARLPAAFAGALRANHPLDAVRRALHSSYVQLAYPWLRTRGASVLPGGIEPPDAVLAGLLARNALLRGTFRSAAGQRTADAWDAYPALPRVHLSVAAVREERTLVERVSLFGRTPAGFSLLSDVTTSPAESYRPAAAHRLVSALVRAARLLGETLVFEASGPPLWARLRTQIETLMIGLYREGALRGANAAEAFQARCDRTTMRQADLDAGRVIAEVRFDAALPIDRITVVLSLNAAGEVMLAAPLEPAA